LKHKDTEIDFRLEEAEKAAENLPPPSHEAPPPTPEELDKFERLARISPRSAMMEVRRSVEEAIKTVAHRSPNQTFGSPRTMLRSLRASKSIDPAVASVFDEILMIGNIAAHEGQAGFTAEDAIRYRALAEKAIERVAADVEQLPNA